MLEGVGRVFGVEGRFHTGFEGVLRRRPRVRKGFEATPLKRRRKQHQHTERERGERSTRPKEEGKQ